MMWEILFLLLPLAAFSGWMVGKRYFSRRSIEQILSTNHTLFNRRPEKNAQQFVEWLEANQETVDTHLTLGNIFRRRGEVGKAIGIHQNLIAKSALTEDQRALSLLELSRDYMRAGVLDRAEQVLLELVKEGRELEATLHHLIDIYQQSKDWLHAIEIARKLQETTKRNMEPQIAHFYCELAEQRWLKGEREMAFDHIKEALKENPDCVRASILLGNLETNAGHFKSAIKAYQQVEKQDPAFLSEIVFPIARCFEALDMPDGMVKYFTHCLEKTSTLSAVLAFSDWLNKTKGEAEATKFVAEHLRVHPSVHGLSRLVQYSLARAEGGTKADLGILQELIDKLVANKPLYRCEACGFAGRTLQWQCPGCKRWDVIKPIHE